MSEILAASPQLVEAPSGAPARWPNSLKRAVRSGQQLLQMLDLPTELASPNAEQDFPVFAPLEYIRRMRRGDRSDPLLAQVLGTQQEVTSAAGELDPVGDLTASLIPGLLRKYERRVLLMTTGVCGIHCRYCFRRHFPYADTPPTRARWRQAIELIAEDPTLDEVILSGGDPLAVSDRALTWLIRAIDGIGHIRRIRLHSRLPVVIPQRISPAVREWIKTSRCAVYLVLHFNHAAEIDDQVEIALERLRSAGAVLLNQSVLLRGVNDNLEALRALCLRLVDLQVLPYYLHQLDPVRGAMHFAVDDHRAIELADQLRRHLPGYAVPLLVREVAGQPHKTPLR